MKAIDATAQAAMHVVRLGASGIGGKEFRFPQEKAAGEPDTCRACGCTDDRACRGDCAWESEDRDLCTQCVERALILVNASRRGPAAAAEAVEAEASVSGKNIHALAMEIARQRLGRNQ